MNTYPRPTRLLPILIGAAWMTLAGTALAAGNPAASSAAPAAPAMPAHATAAAPAPAENVVYKWKDAQGVSQYSQQPPPKGVKFEVVPISAAAPHDSSPPPSSGSGNF